MSEQPPEGYDGGVPVAAYGATAQPAIAARMAPQLRMVVAGTISAAVAVVASLVALLVFPEFEPGDRGRGWAVLALVACLLMLAAAAIQYATWRRALASWRGERVQDLHGEARLSWSAHVGSYVAVLLGLLGAMGGSADAGWTANSAVLLAVALLFLLVAHALAGVQFLRPSGPPGTLPAHMRRLIERAERSRRG